MPASSYSALSQSQLAITMEESITIERQIEQVAEDWRLKQQQQQQKASFQQNVFRLLQKLFRSFVIAMGVYLVAKNNGACP